MGERLLCTQKVNGSIPLFSTKYRPPLLNPVGNHIEEVVVVTVATVMTIWEDCNVAK